MAERFRFDLSETVEVRARPITGYVQPPPLAAELRDDAGTEYRSTGIGAWHGHPTRFGDLGFVPAIPDGAQILLLRLHLADETRPWPTEFEVPLSSGAGPSGCGGQAELGD